MMRPVWVIDDDRSIRWVFEKALAREGIPFKTFAQATEAMEALDTTGAPQVLVSDIRMPGTSGLELLQTLKQRFPDLPVIVMTAYSDLESAVAAFQGGAFEYLPKPFDVDQAVELIRRALGESMRENEAEESSTGTPELLGHERGAFTGAQALRRGRFEQAEDGTLFLDEIGDMPAELQTRLLRVLSDGTFYRVGGHQPIRASVRVIAATNQDLETRVREGLFREDLYHRLTVMSPTQVIEVGDFPPELREDAAAPSGEWLAALGREADRRLVSGETNIMEDLSRSFERTLIAKALAHTGGRRIEAAGLLGIGRNTITRKIGELGIGEETPADAQ